MHKICNLASLGEILGYNEELGPTLTVNDGFYLNHQCR